MTLRSESVGMGPPDCIAGQYGAGSGKLRPTVQRRTEAETASYSPRYRRQLLSQSGPSHRLFSIDRSTIRPPRRTPPWPLRVVIHSRAGARDLDIVRPPFPRLFRRLKSIDVQC